MEAMEERSSTSITIMIMAPEPHGHDWDWTQDPPVRLPGRPLTASEKKKDCSLGLGGGEGLNFVVPASGLARYLLGHSIEQPEPSLSALETVDS
jgi:hypothetical protein